MEENRIGGAEHRALGPVLVRVGGLRRLATIKPVGDALERFEPRGKCKVADARLDHHDGERVAHRTLQMDVERFEGES